MFDIQSIVSSRNDRSLFIAGPCSAESREQVFATAEQLSKEAEISLFRCGVWKPRSSPHSFEGCGTPALQWLQEVQCNFELPVCIEIAVPQHVEAALKYDIRHFWIGARTTVNPFMVQALADAVKGTNVSILVKNPISENLYSLFSIVICIGCFMLEYKYVSSVSLISIDCGILLLYR